MTSQVTRKITANKKKLVVTYILYTNNNMYIIICYSMQK